MPFDESKASHVLRFFRKVLKVKLPPWQKKLLSDVFGTVRSDGRRQYRVIYIEVPGRNGKSVLLGGLGLYLELYGGETHNQVHVAAATKNQTANIFSVALDYAQDSAILSSILKPLPATKYIQRRNDLLSFYRAISGDGGKNDGFGGFVLLDEAHRWHSASQLALWEVIKKAGLSLDQPLRVIITTAGSSDESPLALSLHNRALGILEGKIVDPTFYPLIYGLTPEDDWHEEANWIKVNPSLKENGGYLDIQALREIYQAALGDPVAERSFRRFHLNTWLTSTIEGAIDMADWKQCNQPLRDDLKDRPCFLALDLSSRIDLAALAAVWPDYDTGTFDAAVWAWLPLEMVPKAGQRDKVPYERWHKQGHLLASEGRVIRIEDILNKVTELQDTLDVREVAVDRWGMDELRSRMEAKGLTVIPIPQTFGGMSGPTKRLLELVKDAKLRTGDNPLLTWSASCLDLKTDHAGNCQPAKPPYNKSDKRIDPIVALTMALDRAIRHGFDNSDPYADGHDVITINY